MFNYLFITYLLLAVTAVGRLILQRDRALFLDLENEAGLAVPFAVGVAYVLAAAFARPMAVLRNGGVKKPNAWKTGAVLHSASGSHTRFGWFCPFLDLVAPAFLPVQASTGKNAGATKPDSFTRVVNPKRWRNERPASG
jgi:hypothetical protein